MNRIITILIGIFLFHGGVGRASEPVALVKNGRPVSVIVTSDAPPAGVQQAAEDLRMWMRRSSGAVVPIQMEGEIAKNAGRNLILVGDTKRTRSFGIDPDRFDLEEIVVRTFPGVLVIVGDDARPDGYLLNGTQLAVDTFAENILGVRVLWPGELGEIVPRRSTITVKDIDIRVKPALVDRDLDNHGFNGVTHTKLDALGWDRKAYKNYQAGSNLWFRFHRMGGSYTGNFGHAFGHYWDKYHEEHPDWFAMQPDGTRDNTQPNTGGYPSHRLCISNPGLIAQVAGDCIESLRKNPTQDAVSVSPNDGGNQTFCLCPRCEGWDAPEAKTILMRSKKGRIRHVSLSDRFVRFYSAVAEIVSKELPDRYIGAYAYSLYTVAPIHAKLHPRVVIGFVPGSKMYFDDAKREEIRTNWLAWSKSAEKLFLRPNSLMGLHALPTVFVHRLGEDMRFFTDHGMLFARYDCHFHHWATNGLNYYVIAKLLWDPYADVDAIVAEYCVAGFGPAAEAVRRYFDEIERISTAIAAERVRPGAAAVARHYTDDALGKLHGILDEAKRVAGYDERVKKRIAFLRRGLDYAPVCRDYLVAKESAEDGDKWQYRRFTEQSVRRASWFQELGPSRVLHAPWLIYWDW